MEPRSFAWLSKDTRQYSACLSTIIATFDEIVYNMEHFKHLEEQYNHILDEENKQHTEDPLQPADNQNIAGENSERSDDNSEHLYPHGSHQLEGTRRLTNTHSHQVKHWMYRSHKDINSNKSIHPPGSSDESGSSKKSEDKKRHKSRKKFVEMHDEYTMTSELFAFDDRSEYKGDPKEKIKFAPYINIIPILQKMEIDDPNMETYENILCNGIERVLNIVDTMADLDDFAPSDLLTRPEDDEC